MPPLLALLSSPDVAAGVAERGHIALDHATRRLADVRSEAELALGLLQRPPLAPLEPPRRVLEVGAGTGVVSSILRARGLDVTALEPVIPGFDLFDVIREELTARGAQLAALDRRPAAALDPARDGLFDRIFSINVLEHCQPLGQTLDRLAAVLAPGGVMVHSCPNYRIPYEPHYRMPLVPLAPRLTALARSHLAEEPLWRSLNFITAGDVRRAARRNRLAVHFEAGVLSAAVARLARDPAFARRQGWAGRLAAAVGRADRFSLLERLPGSWLTPMIIVLRREEAPGTPAPRSQCETGGRGL